MEYTEEQFKKADEEIKELIESGKYKQVNMDIINNLNCIVLEPETLKMLSRVSNLYFEYLDNIVNIPEKDRQSFLESSKREDIKDNQQLELEDMARVSRYMKYQKEFAIDRILKTEKLDNNSIQEIYKLLMENTSTESKITKGFRKNNRKYVGEMVDGNRVIQYFPLDYSMIESAMEKILDYYNENNNENNIKDIFLKPIIIHGLVAAYQCFDDGNTRLARLLQHVKIFELTNKLTLYELELPCIYATKTYYPYRIEYRNLIKKLVLDNNSVAWNEWITFNLKRLEDRLYYLNDKVEQISSSNKTSKYY